MTCLLRLRDWHFGVTVVRVVRLVRAVPLLRPSGVGNRTDNATTNLITVGGCRRDNANTFPAAKMPIFHSIDKADKADGPTCAFPTTTSTQK